MKVAAPHSSDSQKQHVQPAAETTALPATTTQTTTTQDVPPQPPLVEEAIPPPPRAVTPSSVRRGGAVAGKDSTAGPDDSIRSQMAFSGKSACSRFNPHSFLKSKCLGMLLLLALYSVNMSPLTTRLRRAD